MDKAAEIPQKHQLVLKYGILHGCNYILRTASRLSSEKCWGSSSPNVFVRTEGAQGLTGNNHHLPTGLSDSPALTGSAESHSLPHRGPLSIHWFWSHSVPLMYGFMPFHRNLAMIASWISLKVDPSHVEDSEGRLLPSPDNLSTRCISLDHTPTPLEATHSLTPAWEVPTL